MRRRQPRCGRHVFEFTVTLVVQQQVADLPVLHHGANQEQIRLAVTVVIQHDDAGPEALADGPAQITDGAGAEILGCRPAGAGGELHVELLFRQEQRQRSDGRGRHARRPRVNHRGVFAHVGVFHVPRGEPIGTHQGVEFVEHLLPFSLKLLCFVRLVRRLGLGGELTIDLLEAEDRYPQRGTQCKSLLIILALGVHIQGRLCQHGPGKGVVGIHLRHNTEVVRRFARVAVLMQQAEAIVGVRVARLFAQDVIKDGDRAVEVRRVLVAAVEQGNAEVDLGHLPVRGQVQGLLEFLARLDVTHRVLARHPLLEVFHVAAAAVVGFECQLQPVLRPRRPVPPGETTDEQEGDHADEGVPSAAPRLGRGCLAHEVIPCRFPATTRA